MTNITDIIIVKSAILLFITVVMLLGICLYIKGLPSFIKYMLKIIFICVNIQVCIFLLCTLKLYWFIPAIMGIVAYVNLYIAKALVGETLEKDEMIRLFIYTFVYSSMACLFKYCILDLLESHGVTCMDLIFIICTTFNSLWFLETVTFNSVTIGVENSPSFYMENNGDANTSGSSNAGANASGSSNVGSLIRPTRFTPAVDIYSRGIRPEDLFSFVPSKPFNLFTPFNLPITNTHILNSYALDLLEHVKAQNVILNSSPTPEAREKALNEVAESIHRFRHLDLHWGKYTQGAINHEVHNIFQAQTKVFDAKTECSREQCSTFMNNPSENRREPFINQGINRHSPNFFESDPNSR